MPEETPPDPRYPADYPADKARQGEIILRRRWQRLAFITGLVAALALGLLLGFLQHSP